MQRRIGWCTAGTPERGSGGLVTLAATTRDSGGKPWESAAQFRASAAGTLNLATAVPVSGSYHVADAAGLLWSLRPAFATAPDTQFRLGTTGFTVRLQVLAGGSVQAAATLVRQWSFATGPTIQTVARDGFASTLFTPDRIRPGAPAVVVIGGSDGGEETFTAGALALLGYPALALGYFQEPGLPTCLCAIPLEYFARAVRWLRTQPVARGRPVVLWGASRGAEGALVIASYEPHLFDAVIADSPRTPRDRPPTSCGNCAARATGGRTPTCTTPAPVTPIPGLPRTFLTPVTAPVVPPTAAVSRPTR